MKVNCRVSSSTKCVLGHLKPSSESGLPEKSHTQLSYGITLWVNACMESVWVTYRPKFPFPVCCCSRGLLESFSRRGGTFPLCSCSQASVPCLTRAAKGELGHVCLCGFLRLAQLCDGADIDTFLCPQHLVGT